MSPDLFQLDSSAILKSPKQKHPITRETKGSYLQTSILPRLSAPPVFTQSEITACRIAAVDWRRCELGKAVQLNIPLSLWNFFLRSWEILTSSRQTLPIMQLEVYCHVKETLSWARWIHIATSYILTSPSKLTSDLHPDQRSATFFLSWSHFYLFCYCSRCLGVADDREPTYTHAHTHTHTKPQWK